MNSSEANPCPSHFALDAHELHGADPAVGRHLEECARCRERLTERAAHLATFRETAAPLWTRIAAGGRERRRRQRLLGFQVPAVVLGLGAVALVIVARGVGGPRAPASYVGPKGSAAVAITCRRVGAILELAPGDDVMPGDVLRFRPLPIRPDARFIQIGSVDGSGRYTPFYPPATGAASIPLPEPGQPLAGGIELDAAPGPERLFVVLSATPVSASAVAGIAVARAATTTTVDAIDGVPVASAWIVLPKRGAKSP